MNKQLRKTLLSFLMVFAILAIGTIAYLKLSAQKKSSIQAKPPKSQLRSVETMQFKPENVQQLIRLDGRLSAFEKINLFAEVQGIIKSGSKPFKVGTYFEKGSLLFGIDAEDARLNLLAQRSSLMTAITQMMPDLKFDYPEAFVHWKAYLDAFDVNKSVAPLPETTEQGEKYYVTGKNIYNLYYTVKSLENKLSDYKVYAPFSGVVTQANVFKGQLVNPGVNLGTLMNTSRFELQAPISLADLKYVKVGQKVNLYSADLDQSWTGTVNRISRVIDAQTQYLPVFISVTGKGLREGMYLTGELQGSNMSDVIAIENSQVIENTVFVVKDSVLQKRPIEVLKRDDVYTYTKDLRADEAVVVSTLTGLYEGQKVAFKNQTKTK